MLSIPETDEAEMVAIGKWKGLNRKDGERPDEKHKFVWSPNRTGYVTP